MTEFASVCTTSMTTETESPEISGGNVTVSTEYRAPEDTGLPFPVGGGRPRATLFVLNPTPESVPEEAERFVKGVFVSRMAFQSGRSSRRPSHSRNREGAGTTRIPRFSNTAAARGILRASTTRTTRPMPWRRRDLRTESRIFVGGGGSFLGPDHVFRYACLLKQFPHRDPKGGTVAAFPTAARQNGYRPNLPVYPRRIRAPLDGIVAGLWVRTLIERWRDRSGEHDDGL